MSELWQLRTSPAVIATEIQGVFAALSSLHDPKLSSLYLSTSGLQQAKPSVPEITYKQESLCIAAYGEGMC